MNEMSTEFFKFIDDLLVGGIVVVITVVVVCVIVICVVHLGDELTNALVLAQGSDTFLLRVVGRPTALLVTNDAAQIVAARAMIVLIVSKSFAVVVVSSALSTILAVDEMGVDGRNRRSSFCRQRRVEVRYQPIDRVHRLVVGQFTDINFFHRIEEFLAEYFVVTVGLGQAGLGFVHTTDKQLKTELAGFVSILCSNCVECQVVPFSYQRPLMLSRN